MTGCCPLSAGLCESEAVKRPVLISRLLAMLLIAGLVTASLTAPAAESSVVSTATAAASMSDDMPCCPDKSPPADCDKCQLMAICVFKSFQAVPSTAVAELLPTIVRTLVPRSDPDMESLGHPPPPRPPRFLVRSA